MLTFEHNEGIMRVTDEAGECEFRLLTHHDCCRLRLHLMGKVFVEVEGQACIL